MTIEKNNKKLEQAFYNFDYFIKNAEKIVKEIWGKKNIDNMKKNFMN